MDKDFYNKSSAKSLGWNPSWFGCDEFDFNLVKAVQKWQKLNGLTGDGLVGPMTYRRIWTERETLFQLHGTRWFYGITERGLRLIRVVILIILENLTVSQLCL